MPRDPHPHRKEDRPLWKEWVKNCNIEGTGKMTMSYTEYLERVIVKTRAAVGDLATRVSALEEG